MSDHKENPGTAFADTETPFALLHETVFPSEDATIKFRDTPRGCDEYTINEMIGFDKEKNRPVYGNSTQTIRFVHSNVQQGMNYGLQSEQLVLMLIDRTRKLNKQLPSPHSAKMIAGLEVFMDACRERFEERIKAGVAGTPKPLPGKS